MSRCLAATLVGALLAGGTLAAEPSLDSVTVEARLKSGTPSTVSMTYFLRPAGATEVIFRSLQFGRFRVTNVRAFLGEQEVSFRILGPAEGRVDGRVDLPETAPDGRIRLRLVYEVLPEVGRLAASFAPIIPLLVAEWPPAETRPEAFVATVHLPADVHLYSAFPFEFTRIESVELTAEGSVYRFALPVIPAMIRLRGGSEPPALLTAERVVDVGAVAALIVLAGFGWRRMRKGLG